MADKHFNIGDMFEMVADAMPEREALVCGESRATFQQLEQRANRLAHYMSAQGVNAGDHVGLYMYNCSEYIEAMLACFKIRAVPINVNYRYVNEELLYIFDNANMVACIHNREFVPAIAQVRDAAKDLTTFISVEDGSDHDLSAIGSVEFEAAMSAHSDQRDFAPRADDDLFILYTGGTTGMPKGVMWPHKNVFFAAMGGGGHFSPLGPLEQPEDIVSRISENQMIGMPLAPLMHGASWWYACILILSGNKLVLNPLRTFDGEGIWQVAADEKVNSIQIVGDAMAIPLLESLKGNEERWDLSAVFNIGSGGAVFSPAKQEEFKVQFPNCFITNAFGSSESGNMGMDNGNKKEGDSSLGNVARSEFMDVVIEGDTPAECRHAKPGEQGIFSRSGYIPAGYYGDEAKTAKTFIDVEGKGKIWLLTGDAATLEEDGTITIFGRGSNCINSGGEKIFPEEVEQALKAHPAIYDALVVDTPDERFGAKVTAVVSVREGYDVSLKAVQEEARKLIAGYKLPRELHIVAEVPRGPNGKPTYAEAKKIALSQEFLVS
jgi:acyl-CoA synthetase (AMP-forming)/AMP-acid ligase II